jgi:hypothetical protein
MSRKKQRIKRRIITPTDFIDGIMQGERDFSSIRFLRKESRFPKGGYKALCAYLREIPVEEHKENPLILDKAHLSHMDLQGFKLPYLSAKRAYINYTVLDNGTFLEADFRGASFHELSPRNAIFYNCKFDGAKFRDFTLEKSVVRDCTFTGLRENFTAKYLTEMGLESGLRGGR